MPRSSPSSRAVSAAIVATADAMRSIVSATKRARTWRADLEALRATMATLASARRHVGGSDGPEPIGFTAEGSTQLADSDETSFDGSEHPDHGCDVEVEHETERR